jgi:hypothetical protein
MLKKTFYLINGLFVAVSLGVFVFISFWRQFKNYNMSMRETWIVGGPFVSALLISLFFNAVYLFKNKEKTLIDKILLAVFLLLNLIGLSFVVKALFV